MKTIRYSGPLLAVLLAGAALPAAAQDGQDASKAAFRGTPIDNAGLAEQRGGAQSQVSNASLLLGTVKDTQAINVRTGSNLIDGASFSGAAGLITALQNSGNNVLFQNSTIVNVQVR